MTKNRPTKSTATPKESDHKMQHSSSTPPPMPAQTYNPYTSTAKSGFQLSTLIMIAVFFFAGFFIGSLWQENQMLKTGGSNSGANQAAVPLDAETNEPSMDYSKMPALSDADYFLGNRNAKVVLVEYSDFECPFCGRFHPTTKQALDEYGDDLGLAYRHYPLAFHPNAQKAAEAAECVGKQKGSSGFWAFADAIFEVNITDGKLTPEAITDAAQTTGVNMDQFQSCLDSGEMAGKVTEQMNAGATAGVQGTPGTFVVVDGKAVDFISGALPYEQVKATLDQYIN